MCYVLSIISDLLSCISSLGEREERWSHEQMSMSSRIIDHCLCHAFVHGVTYHILCDRTAWALRREGCWAAARRGGGAGHLGLSIGYIQ